MKRLVIGIVTMMSLNLFATEKFGNLTCEKTFKNGDIFYHNGQKIEKKYSLKVLFSSFNQTAVLEINDVSYEGDPYEETKAAFLLFSAGDVGSSDYEFYSSNDFNTDLTVQKHDGKFVVFLQNRITNGEYVMIPCK